jgi:hypothetical protein
MNENRRWEVGGYESRYTTKYVKTGIVHEFPHAEPWDPRFYKMMQENWYPNFPGDTVQVFLREHKNGACKVSIWGADDMGVELDNIDKEYAHWLFDAIGDGITRDALYDFGFVGA